MKSQTTPPRHTLIQPLPLMALLCSLLLPGVTKAAELTLAISLGMTQQKAETAYRPLLRYLSQATGEQFRLEVSPNSFAHWERMRREGYDVVIDNPAFTAYRVKKMDYTVIAKLPEVLSFTLVTSAEEMMFEPSELIGRSVASQPSPAMTALRLQELFSNPMRQPKFIQVGSHVDALQMVSDGRAAAAMVPTSLLSGYRNLVPLYTTEQFPAPAISVGPQLAPELSRKLRQALLEAPDSRAGRAALEALNVASIEEAGNRVYSGQEQLLAGLFGY